MFGRFGKPRCWRLTRALYSREHLTRPELFRCDGSHITEVPVARTRALSHNMFTWGPFLLAECYRWRLCHQNDVAATLGFAPAPCVSLFVSLHVDIGALDPQISDTSDGLQSGWLRDRGDGLGTHRPQLFPHLGAYLFWYVASTYRHSGFTSIDRSFCFLVLDGHGFRGDSSPNLVTT